MYNIIDFIRCTRVSKWTQWTLASTQASTLATLNFRRGSLIKDFLLLPDLNIA